MSKSHISRIKNFLTEAQKIYLNNLDFPKKKINKKIFGLLKKKTKKILWNTVLLRFEKILKTFLNVKKNISAPKIFKKIFLTRLLLPIPFFSRILTASGKNSRVTARPCLQRISNSLQDFLSSTAAASLSIL